MKREADESTKADEADGHYLNLPVVDHDGKLVAIVDVLKLTYATLEQVSTESQLNIPGNRSARATRQLTPRWKTWQTTRPTIPVGPCGANSLKRSTRRKTMTPPP